MLAHILEFLWPMLAHNCFTLVIQHLDREFDVIL
jgi:hypothetical protein